MSNQEGIKEIEEEKGGKECGKGQKESVSKRDE